jgi:hypothetical protein
MHIMPKIKSRQTIGVPLVVGIISGKVSINMTDETLGEDM